MNGSNFNTFENMFKHQIFDDESVSEGLKEFWRRFLDVSDASAWFSDSGLDYSDYNELLVPLGLPSRGGNNDTQITNAVRALKIAKNRLKGLGQLLYDDSIYQAQVSDFIIWIELFTDNLATAFTSLGMLGGQPNVIASKWNSLRVITDYLQSKILNTLSPPEESTEATSAASYYGDAIGDDLLEIFELEVDASGDGIPDWWDSKSTSGVSYHEDYTMSELFFNWALPGQENIISGVMGPGKAIAGLESIVAEWAQSQGTNTALWRWAKGFRFNMQVDGKSITTLRNELGDELGINFRDAEEGSQESLLLTRLNIFEQAWRRRDWDNDTNVETLRALDFEEWNGTSRSGDNSLPMELFEAMRLVLTSIESISYARTGNADIQEAFREIFLHWNSYKQSQIDFVNATAAMPRKPIKGYVYIRKANR